MPLSLNNVKSYKEILEDYLIQIASEGDIENLMATDGKVNHLEIVNGVCKIDTDLPSYVYYVETEGNFKFEISKNPSIENKKITLFVLCKGTNSNNYVQFPINVRGVKNNVINYSNQKNFIHKFDLETHNSGNFWFLDNRGEVFGLPYDTTITAPNEKITIEWDILPQDESNYSDISNIRIYDENLDAVLYPCLSTPDALQYYDGEVPQSDRYIWLDQTNEVLHFYFTGLLDRTPKNTLVQCGNYNPPWNSQYITSQANFEKVTEMPDMIEAELSIEYSNASQDLGLKYPAVPGTLSAFAHNNSQDDPFTSYGLMLCGSAPYDGYVPTNTARYGHKKVRLTLFTNHKISQIHFLNGAVFISDGRQCGGTNGYYYTNNVNATSSNGRNSITAYYASKCTKYSAQFASKVKTAIYYDDKLIKEDMYVGTYGVAETHDIYL